MSVKNADILQIGQPETKPIMDQLLRRPLPGKVTYALVKNLRLAAQAAEDFDKARIAICEQTGTFNKETGRFDISDQDAFNKAYNELLDAEAVQPWNMIPKARIDETEISGAELLPIFWMIAD